MTLALFAFGAAVLVWPSRGGGAARLSRLVDAARLASAREVVAARGGWRGWRRPRLSAGAASALAAIGAGSSAGVWRGAAVGVAAGAVAAVVATSIGRAAGRRAEAARDRDLSAALRLLRAELDIGSAPDQAFSAAAAVAGMLRPAFEAAAHAARHGDDIVSAMSGAADVGASAELLLIGRAWQLAEVTGAPLADVLGRIDDDVAARRAQTRAVGAALAGPRSSAALLAALPALGVALGAAMGAHPIAVLFGSAHGHVLLCAGVLLDVAGVVWTARISSSAERP